MSSATLQINVVPKLPLDRFRKRLSLAGRCYPSVTCDGKFYPSFKKVRFSPNCTLITHLVHEVCIAHVAPNWLKSNHGLEVIWATLPSSFVTNRD
jgi:hypothetical protein